MDYRLIDLENIKHNNPKKINRKYIGQIIYNDGNKLKEINIKTPFLKCISPIIISGGRCYIEVELDMEDRDFYEFLSDFDDLNINIAYKNSKIWFDEQFPLDIIDEYYTPFVRLHNKLRRPYIRINIPYNQKNGFDEKIKEEDFRVGNLISMDLHCDGLRFYKQRFTGEWSLTDYEVEYLYEFNGPHYDELAEVKELGENKKEEKENVEEKIKEEIIEEEVVEKKEQEKEGEKEKTEEGEKEKEEEKKGEEKKEEEEKEEEKEKTEEKTEKKEKTEERDEKKGENNIEVEKEEKNMKKEKKTKEKKERGSSKGSKRKKKIIKYANKNRIWM